MYDNGRADFPAPPPNRQDIAMSYPVNDRQLIRDCEIGEGTKVWNFVNMYGCKVGRDSMIGTFVEVQGGVTIGDRTRVQSHTFICELVTIGNDVFVGHGVMFINDTMPPRSPRRRSGRPPSSGTGPSLGSNSHDPAGARRQERRRRRRRRGDQGCAGRRHRGRPCPGEDPALQRGLRAEEVAPPLHRLMKAAYF
jgi:hypothetical protein